jgi:hypothetical protein
VFDAFYLIKAENKAKKYLRIEIQFLLKGILGSVIAQRGCIEQVNRLLAAASTSKKSHGAQNYLSQVLPAGLSIQRLSVIVESFV